ncbi:protein RGF1 INDUCIBLE TRANSCRIPTION FACTOR 1-like isoform X2 [Mangifera indica]|uniref:protein RGF1 INDUCIBLE TRANSCRIPTION FACTOR 1-like isoform X2 n=1 Tax=Mangifera indica TaxID=29780 RepID=UPI001CFB2BBD|nr:protein RGF1 INDUCIBLE TRANSCRIPTION FACTOR 1-like isoform X2 [Mangifera indica]
MGREEYSHGGGMNKPAWLQGLMAETFFGACGFHENRRKNEKNVFCLVCCLSLCPHCLPSHCSHPLLQVRRYVYHDVVRLGDLEKLIDCSFIQVDYMVYRGQDLSSILFRIHESDFAISQIEGLRVDGSEIIDDDGLITSNSILEDPLQDKNSSCSNDNMGSSEISHAPVVVNKKKKGFLPGIVLSLSNRRKGAPQRAPLS